MRFLSTYSLTLIVTDKYLREICTLNPDANAYFMYTSYTVYTYDINVNEKDANLDQLSRVNFCAENFSVIKHANKGDFWQTCKAH